MDAIEICAGDFVLIDESYTDEDGFEYELSGTVIDINQNKTEVKVAFYLRVTDDDTFLESGNEDDDEDVEYARWFPVAKIYQIEREYKVMEIEDNIDTNTNEPMTIAKLSKINKGYLKVSGGYRVHRTCSHSNFDIFILSDHSAAYNSICYQPELNKIINFENFKLGHSFANGITQPTYYDKPDESFYFISENYNNNED